MSHSVTITRTTTTTTTSAILLNTGYLKSLPGLLKLAELVIGAVVIGLVASSISKYRSFYSAGEELFFLIIACSCLLATGCLLISCLISISTASIIAKTIFELVYHGIAFVLMLIASILALIEASGNSRNQYNYEIYLAAAILVLLIPLTLLYSSSSMLTMIQVIRRNYDYKIYEPGFSKRIDSCILGLINSGLYLLSTILAYKSYRGG